MKPVIMLLFVGICREDKDRDSNVQIFYKIKKFFMSISVSYIHISKSGLF